MFPLLRSIFAGSDCKFLFLVARKQMMTMVKYGGGCLLFLALGYPRFRRVTSFALNAYIFTRLCLFVYRRVRVFL